MDRNWLRLIERAGAPSAPNQLYPLRHWGGYALGARRMTSRFGGDDLDRISQQQTAEVKAEVGLKTSTPLDGGPNQPAIWRHRL